MGARFGSREGSSPRESHKIAEESFDFGVFSTFPVDQVEVCDHSGQGPAMAEGREMPFVIVNRQVLESFSTL